MYSMKNDDLDPSEAAAAAIDKLEEEMNSSLYDRFSFEGELEQFEANVQDLFQDISSGTKGKGPKFDNGDLVDKTMFDDKTITKAKLSGWLVTALEVIHHTVWNMSNGNRVMHRLKDEKIADKEAIIRLQGEVIKKHSAEFSAVQDTMKTEMKSYSQIAMKKSAAPAITQKQLKTVVREAVAQDDRSKNVMVFGLEEEVEENLGEKIAQLMEDLGEKPHVIDCTRIGKAAVSVKKPVKVTLRSPEVARQILANSRKLRQVTGRKAVFICPDRTPEEREFYSKLNEEMKKKMKDDPGQYYFIRNKKICHVDRRPPDEA